VDVDAYSIENLLIGGFPLVTSVATLVVMFGLLLKLDVTVALLSLAVVPFLYLCIRYYISTLLNREESVKELESARGAAVSRRSPPSSWSKASPASATRPAATSRRATARWMRALP
jgi:ABC-type multidrug transport system fused ATPase/permease subunit